MILFLSLSPFLPQPCENLLAIISDALEDLVVAEVLVNPKVNSFPLTGEYVDWCYDITYMQESAREKYHRLCSFAKQDFRAEPCFMLKCTCNDDII